MNANHWASFAQADATVTPIRSQSRSPSLAVVIPCYRSGEGVLSLIERIGPEVGWIVVVDDACPLKTGHLVQERCTDPRVQVIFHAQNQGVGGAMVSGYKAALKTPAQVVVKLDSDGQMDPALIPRLARSVLAGQADYSKGNRFFQVADVRNMPRLRLLGNAVLSFLSKLSTGYWQLFDPTNGFTAIHRRTLAALPLDHLSPRYFFESDLLFRLGQLRAVVRELPMVSVYAGEPSSLSPMAQIRPFLRGHALNFCKRLIYDYLLRGFSVASIQLIWGLLLLSGGTVFGLLQWIGHVRAGVPASAGTVMLAALPVLVGVQCLLAWLAHDMANDPRTPFQLSAADAQPEDGSDQPVPGPC
ncbi:MAG: glycosyltransferase family 2 protein [Xanthomonadales bacterium]|nr:glycosyltransferase family 2 protein [Xanthomonadales bacterium]